MNAPLAHPRYERKFVADGCTPPEVLARIRCHPSGFREVFPPRIVNNLYLDSSTRRDYHDHVHGTPNRSKTRIRWYGRELAATNQPRLERKLKRGTVSGKETYPLPSLSDVSGPLGRALNRAFDVAELPALLRSSLRHQQPALFNRYQRHYFASHDGKFRLTVDFDLQFAGVAQDCWPRRRVGAVVPVVVIELKFAVEFAPEAERVSNALPFRLTRFSKYVAGLERT